MKQNGRIILLDHKEALCISLLVSLYSIFYFLLFKNITAFEWPATDLSILLAKNVYPEFWDNDFMLEAMLDNNPRHFWALFIINISHLFGVGWYDFLFILKIVFVACIPGLYCYYILDVIKEKVSSRFLIYFVGIVICLSLNDAFNGKFVIGGWRPIFTYVGPATICVFTSLIAAILSQKRLYPLATLFLWVISVFFHPAITVFFWVFNTIFNFDRKRMAKHLAEITVIFSSLLAFKVLYSSDVILSTQSFIDYYIRSRHAHHYLPSSFNKFIYFEAISLVFLIGAVLGFLHKKKYLLFTSLCMMVSYCGSVLLQYLFIEIYPIRIVASLGPIRYSYLGFWGVLIIFSLMVDIVLSSKVTHYVQHLANIGFIKKIKATLYFPIKWSKFKILSQNNHALTSIIAIISLFCIFILKDSPLEDHDNKELYEFVEEYTDQDSIFIVPSELCVKFPLIAQRSLFVSHSFIFSEKYMEEYTKRRELVYGTVAERKKHYNFYDLVDNARIEKIRKNWNVDYIVTKDTIPDREYIAELGKYFIYEI